MMTVRGSHPDEVRAASLVRKPPNGIAQVPCGLDEIVSDASQQASSPSAGHIHADDQLYAGR
uniref:hypothetical protein n=1 Tax=Neorhizobium sp. EC2-8 TaxID=3129230 RepID=UPI003100CE1B